MDIQDGQDKKKNFHTEVPRKAQRKGGKAKRTANEREWTLIRKE